MMVRRCRCNGCKEAVDLGEASSSDYFPVYIIIVIIVIVVIAEVRLLG